MSDLLVDSNVILDVFEEDPLWSNWSQSMLVQYGETHRIAINSFIYTEVSIGFETIEGLERALTRGGFQMLPIPKEALFLAGKAFLSYRKRRGTKHSPLPDFFIGAHAATTNMPLLTRDSSRYKSYFPSISVISPENPDPQK